MRLELVCVALGGGLTQGVHRVLRRHREDDLAIVVGAAGESRSSHITYRTHGRPALFRRKWRHAWPLPRPLFGPFRAAVDGMPHHRPAIRVVAALAVWPGFSWHPGAGSA